MRAVIRWCLDNRAVVILFTLILMAGGILSATRIEEELLPSIQLCRVWPSQAVALAAVHGALTGTCVDIWSSCWTTSTSSGAIVGSGGAVPVGPLSL